MKQALIIIDVQKDFCTGGVLPAKDTNSLIKPLNVRIAWAIKNNITCFYTRDWHPYDHCSFNTQGGPWPPHCIQGTIGSEFANGLIVPVSSLVIDIEKDSSKMNMSYSAFENTELEKLLKKKKVTHLLVTGIATDYCVKATVLDALKKGFEVVILEDLVRPINVNTGDSTKAIEEMRKKGAIISKSIKMTN